MTDKTQLNRKDFLKLAGLAGVSLPIATVVKRMDGFDILSSPEEYGGFLVRRQSTGDGPIQVDDAIYHRFDEAYTMFKRAIWDEEYIREKVEPYVTRGREKIARGEPGYNRLEFAFYCSAWTSYATQNYLSWQPLGGFGAREGLKDMGAWDYEAEGFSRQQVTDYLKIVAKFYGASMVGITEVNDRWIYARVGSIPGQNQEVKYIPADAPVREAEGDIVIPSDYKYAVVFAFQMDEQGIDGGYNCLSAAAVGNGYSRMAQTAGAVAEFIRDMGYGAIAMGNDTALSVPLAIEAGLGEGGRNGQLVTPKYGPRVRLAKVFTNMPLATDAPISFGVEEFCKACKKCAEYCPSGAINGGEQSWGVEEAEINNNPGVFKWYNKLSECYHWWKQVGVDCANCITVCPFNKPASWLHQATRILIGAESGVIDSLLVNLDNMAGYGQGDQPGDPAVFWSNKDSFMHDTA